MALPLVQRRRKLLQKQRRVPEQSKQTQTKQKIHKYVIDIMIPHSFYQPFDGVIAIIIFCLSKKGIRIVREEVNGNKEGREKGRPMEGRQTTVWSPYVFFLLSLPSHKGIKLETNL